MKAPSKTGLFAAIKAWDATAVTAYLRAAQALVTSTDQLNRQPLHVACSVSPTSHGLREPHGIRTVTAILNAGAGLKNAVPMDADEGDFRATPLWYAIARGRNPALARFLLRRGADASSSLWAVVWNDDAAMCRALLKAGPRLDLRAHGETPLFYAARLQRLKTLDLLIDAGADPAVSDAKGRTALDIARARRLPRSFLMRLESAMERHRG